MWKRRWPLPNEYGQSYFGVQTKLLFNDLKLEAEPTERNIILDVDNLDAFSASRARKLALLAIKAYGVAPNKINLGLSNVFGGLDFVFSAPVLMNQNNLNKVYDALKKWGPIQKSNAVGTLTTLAKLKGPNGLKSAVVLINNEVAPFYTGVNTGKLIDPKTGMDLQYQAFEEQQNLIMKKLAATLNQAQINLFGFWNNYRLYSAALETNGYQLGDLGGWIYPPYNGGVNYTLAIDAPTATKIIMPVPPTNEWQFPALYGKGRLDYYGIQNLILTTSGLSIDNAVMLQELTYNYWGGGCSRCMVMKMDVMPGYYGYKPESTTVTLSGNYHLSGSATLTLTGSLGGLRFSKDYFVSLPSSVGSGAAGSSIWANEFSEVLGNDYLMNNTIAIQQLGSTYHFVNPQMSLLALGPGMALWTELPNSPNQTGTTKANTSALPVADQAKFAGPTGTNLDDVTLEAILAGNVSGIKDIVKNNSKPSQISILRKGDGLQISWTYFGHKAKAQFSILDLSGKIVSELIGSKNGNGYSVIWNGKIKSGTYYVRVTAGAFVQSQKIGVSP